MKKKIKRKEIDIHCACAIGDLSEMAELKPAIKSKAKIEKKTLTKDELKKEDSNSNKIII